MKFAQSESHPSARRQLVLYGLLTLAAVVTSLLLTKNLDFRVYWYGARALADHSIPLYGPDSGIGFPMHYRYPPVTYLLLWPLGRLPLVWSGFIWMLGAWALCSSAVVITIRVARLKFSGWAAGAICAYMLAYVVLAIRSGNVQPYIIALLLLALVLSESHPVFAAILLAIAISFKIWPLFFLPWFLRSGRRWVLAWLVPSLLLHWLAPLLLWSPGCYADLLHQWYWSEFYSATSNSETWYFPGQSLRGVLLRYFTAAEPGLPRFPDIHMLSLSPAIVVAVWKIAAAAIYGAACAAMLRSKGEDRWIWDAFAFALFTILQPFCLKSSMISMGPAALIAGATVIGEKLPRRFFFAACAISLISALVQYKTLLRFFLVAGLDFYAALFVTAALFSYLKRGLSPLVGGSKHASSQRDI